ncbi:hypothetical protein B7463_g4029, partial [Scytalidium lignicola]
MPVNCAEKKKAQPWMAHWPPAAKPSQVGVEYGVQKGEVIVVDGTSAKASTARQEPATEDKKQFPRTRKLYVPTMSSPCHERLLGQ